MIYKKILRLRISSIPWFEDGIAIVGFFIIIGTFFSPTILQGKLPVPSDSLVGLYHPWRDLYNNTNPRGIPFKNFLITDPVRQQIPWRKIAIDQWKDRILPGWNPYNFSGTPLAGNIQAAAFYPLNVLFFFLDFASAWSILILLQPILAGLFFYAYVRSLGIRPLASLIGSIAWSFSGFNVAWMTWGTIGHVALWLPLTLFAVDKFLTPQRRKYVWAVLFVVSMAFQFSAGHAQISLYFVLMVVGYGTMRILQANERRKAALLFAFLLSLVALLTAIQWTPLLDWIRQSGRVIDGSDWTKEGWFIPWAHLVQFVAPDFFGNPTTLNYWGQWNYGEFVGYIGMLPLLFVLIALSGSAIAGLAFWIAAAAIAFLLAFPTPVAYLPYILKLPILSSLQPTRLLFVVDFSLAVLAAYGCNAWLEGAKKRRWVWVITLAGALLAILWGVSVVGSLEVSKRNLVVPTVLFIVAAAMLIMYRRLHRVATLGTILAWSFVGLVAIDLLRFGWKFTPFTPREYFFPETKIITFLKEREKPFRVMSVDKRIFPPNTLSYYGIESIEGYDPIISSRYEELMAAVARGAPDIKPPFGFNRIVALASLRSPLLPILNARYIVSLSDMPEEPYLTKVFEEGETRVYEDSRALPRVYVVERPIVAYGKEETMNALYVMKDYRRQAVVEGNISILSIPIRSDESVSSLQYESNRLEIDTVLSVPRLLVVTNAYHPGWQAMIDGKTTMIYRTNYAFQGIVVPEGRHRVTLTFTQW